MLKFSYQNRLLDCVGISVMKNFILQWCWRKFSQSEMPKLEKTVVLRKQQAYAEINNYETLLDNLNLRKLASRHAARFIQTAQMVISGTSKGNPAITGETLKEEIDKQLFGNKTYCIQK